MKRDILGVVLCGGKSSRMGSDKAALQVREGISQLDYHVGLIAPFCSQLAVCVGPRSGPTRDLQVGLLEVFDVEGVEGPMAGVLAALRVAEGRAVLVVACDMPFLESSHLVQLLNRRNSEMMATCFVASDGMPDPMCCLYEASALIQLEERVAARKLSLRRFLAEARVERIQAANGAFLASVNDPQQLGNARGVFGDL